MSEQQEKELWDLVEDKPDTRAEEYADKKALRKAKKTIRLLTGALALVTAAAVGLGAFAFLGKQDDAALQELKNKAAALQQEKQMQLDRIAELTALNESLSQSLEYVESEMANQQSLGYEQAVPKYQQLILALEAMMTYDEEALLAALDAIGNDISMLDTGSRNAYYMVLEYMEQPYWGFD